MAELSLVVTLGGEDFPLAHVTVQEMMKVKSWTGYKNKDVWFNAIGDDEPEALIAAFVLAKQRKGETVRFSEADFDLDTLGAKFVDGGGREVEPVFEKNDDGTIKTNDGRPLPVLDEQGKPQWVFSDTGDPVPPTEADSPPTSVTPLRRGSSSESDSGIPVTSAS